MKAICGFCEEHKDVLHTKDSPNGFACVDCSVIVAMAFCCDTLGTMEPQQDISGPPA